MQTLQVITLKCPKLAFKLLFYFQFGKETKELYDINCKLAIKMEENRKCKKTIEFGNIRDVNNKYFKIKKI